MRLNVARCHILTATRSHGFLLDDGEMHTIVLSYSDGDCRHGSEIWKPKPDSATSGEQSP